MGSVPTAACPACPNTTQPTPTEISSHQLNICNSTNEKPQVKLKGTESSVRLKPAEIESESGLTRLKSSRPQTMGKPNFSQGVSAPISFKHSSIKKKTKTDSSLDFQNITSKRSLYFSLLLFHRWRKYHWSFTFLLLSSLATPTFIQCTGLWPHYKSLFFETKPDKYFGHKLDVGEIIKTNARALTKTITVTPGQNHFLPSYTCKLQSVSTSFFPPVLHGRQIRNT